MDKTLFEDFMQYCEGCADEGFVGELKTHLADYFDLPNRTIALAEAETRWICENLSPNRQREILGYTLLESPW